jgi:hypothetical protein
MTYCCHFLYLDPNHKELEPRHQKRKGWKKFQGLSPTHVNGQVCWLCSECAQQRAFNGQHLARDKEEPDEIAAAAAAVAANDDQL